MPDSNTPTPPTPTTVFHDDRTTLADCKALVARFVAERDWARHHRPKNLAMSIAIEAAELMEHFQWPEGETPDAVRNDAERMQGVREELSDVLAYCFSLANALEIDLASAYQDKMARNAERYPVGHPGV
ncbi:MAG: nucleotide pyrophosphohydrolase [Planctomycetota bacterium]